MVIRFEVKGQAAFLEDFIVIRKGNAMQKFFQSGYAFMVVALICFLAGVMSEQNVTFIGIGGFWLIMAIITRAKYAKKPTVGNEPKA